MIMKIIAIGIVIIGTLLGAIGAFLIKKSKGIKINIRSMMKDKLLILGIAAYGISPTFNIIAFKWGELTMLYPLITFTYIWSSILAVKYLGEKMNAYKWTGVLFLILGAVFVVR